MVPSRNACLTALLSGSDFHYLKALITKPDADLNLNPDSDDSKKFTTLVHLLLDLEVCDELAVLILSHPNFTQVNEKSKTSHNFIPITAAIICPEYGCFIR